MITKEDERFLEIFELHLNLIKSLTTKEEVVEKLRNKQCPFLGFEKVFEGNELDKEMRFYLHTHPDKKRITKPMYAIINKIWR